MIVMMHMCMPSGDSMRERFGELMEAMKRDNRGVIAAMLADGVDVPETMADLGLTYVPEQHRKDQYGQPIMEIYGIHDMIQRESFSCGDAAAYEAAVLEEKYGIPTLCIAVPQGDDDLHGIYVTVNGAVDPTANYLRGKRPEVPWSDSKVMGSACFIEDGRVVCSENPVCSVDQDGRWDCVQIPGLTGKKEKIGQIYQTSNGQAWARTANGSVISVRRTK